MTNPDEAFELEIAWCLGRIAWLIRIAEATYDRFGADDSDKWDLNGPLLLAIHTAQADFTARRLQQHLPCVCARADHTVTELANSIATRLGDEPQSTWEVEALVELATKVMKP